MNGLTREECLARDAADPLAAVRGEFDLPDGVIYMAGNSLGALPRAVPGAVANLVQREWGQGLVRSWGAAGWWDKPRTLGAKAAPLVGAAADEVVVGDGVSTNLFKVVVAALRLRPERSVVVGERGNFPTDLYVSASAAELVGVRERRVAPAELAQELASGEVAAVVLSHVDFRTGELRDMAGITDLVHRHGALVVWDLCHSVGVVPVRLGECGVDFAVGCTYKYLNAGPGAPSFTFIARRHHEGAQQPLTGWHGHQRPFDFAPDYSPAAGASRFLAGSQPLVAAAALEASLDLWSRIDLEQLRAKGLGLAELFLQLVLPRTQVRLVGPADLDRRGGHIALSHPDAERIVGELAEHGVLADHRPPDLMRFGLAALYLSYIDVFDAAETLVRVANRAV